MGRVHSELVDRHGAAILIGADSPQLEATDLAAAAERLDAAEPTFVIGPARDGGFWLVGANRRLPLTAWDGVTYSREDTRVRFVEAMRAHAGNVSALRLLRDVDDVDDVAPLVAALRRLRTPTAEQRRLLVWLEEAAPAIGIRLDRGPSI